MKIGGADPPVDVVSSSELFRLADLNSSNLPRAYGEFVAKACRLANASNREVARNLGLDLNVDLAILDSLRLASATDVDLAVASDIDLTSNLANALALDPLSSATASVILPTISLARSPTTLC